MRQKNKYLIRVRWGNGTQEQLVRGNAELLGLKRLLKRKGFRNTDIEIIKIE